MVQDSYASGPIASPQPSRPAYLAYAGSGLLIYVADLLFNEMYAETGCVPASAVLAYVALMQSPRAAHLEHLGVARPA